MKERSVLQDRILILIVSVVAFVPFLGGVHLFDWDEINFAECAREMIVSKDYLHIQIGFKPFYEKPPLFIWFQVLSMKIFGINEFAARFPNALCGIISLQVIYTIGSYLKDRFLGLWWALAYVCSFLPHVYFKSGIIDPWFNLFIFLSFFYVYLYFQEKDSIRNVWLGSFFLGLAVLTKGPVAILLLVLSVMAAWLFAFYKKKHQRPILKARLLLHALLFCIMSVFPFLVWYMVILFQSGPDWFYNFISYQLRLLRTEDAGHGGFPGFHLIVLLIGCFPASVFAVQMFFSNYKKDEPILYWMKSLFWVVLIVFSLVQSKIIHYSSLAYFPITFLAARSLHENVTWRFWQKVFSLVLMLILTFCMILIPILGNHLDMLKPLFEKDPFAVANLSAPVHWSAYESLLGILVLLCLLLFTRYLYKNKIKESVITLFVSTFISIQGIIYLIVPKIEAYTQRSVIRFFKTLAGQEVCVNTYGYKSYAHWFYSQVKPEFVCDALDSLDGKTFKAQYVVTKITSGNPPELTHYERWYEKNGFVFWRKRVKP